jgi:hypothetical protein
VAALAGAMVAGVLDHYLFNLNFPHAVALFWLYLGLAVAATMIERLKISNRAGISDTAR